MNLGQFRNLTKGMPDDAEFVSHLMSSCSTDDTLDVVAYVSPNAAKTRVDIVVSIVSRDEGLASGEDLGDCERERQEILAKAEDMAESMSKDEALKGLGEVLGLDEEDKVP